MKASKFLLLALPFSLLIFVQCSNGGERAMTEEECIERLTVKVNEANGSVQRASAYADKARESADKVIWAMRQVHNARSQSDERYAKQVADEALAEMKTFVSKAQSAAHEAQQLKSERLIQLAQQFASLDNATKEAIAKAEKARIEAMESLREKDKPDSLRENGESDYRNSKNESSSECKSPSLREKVLQLAYQKDFKACESHRGWTTKGVLSNKEKIQIECALKCEKYRPGTKYALSKVKVMTITPKQYNAIKKAHDDAQLKSMADIVALCEEYTRILNNY